jgi:hypothetical protein
VEFKIAGQVISYDSFLNGDYKIYLEKGERRHKEAIKPFDLMKYTNYFSRRRAPNCRATLMRSEKKKQRWVFNVKCGETYSDTGGHLVRIRALKGDGTNLRDRNVLCSCTCPAFLYYGGMYQAQSWGYHDSGWEGKSPIVPPPTVQLHLKKNFWVCKHIYTALEDAKYFTVESAE